MKNQIKYYLIGITILILSSPLGYTTLNIIYANRNLTGEFEALLNGFIHSYMLIGVLVFSIGLINLLLNINKSNMF